ncbi:MAG TPA: hypothetical protein VFV11_07490 [Solimonas sp.]|nr:hypothetical protein [Solimonas sp.]
MDALGFSVLVTAVLSSLFTWGLAWLYFRHRLQARLEAETQRLLAEFETRVHAGVLRAGRELLPELRAEVREGFLDALKGSPTAGLVEDAAGAVKTGADLVGGLASMLGLKRR